MNRENNIFITQPRLPSLDHLNTYLEEIWEERWITNNGKFHGIFQDKVKDFLGVKHCSIMSNGTIALMIGLKAMGITGEVITTPFTFCATTHALHWNGLTPVFCDIEEGTCNLDPERIRSLISPKK